MKKIYLSFGQFWPRLWGWLKTRPGVWAGRIGSIIKLNAEVLEVVDFGFVLLFICYLNSQWFTGPYTVALHHAIANWVAISTTGLAAACTFFGFLERNFALRRAGAFGCFIVFLSVGIASISHFPHWLIGFLLLWASSVPLLCFLLIAVFQIKEEKQSDIPERIKRQQAESAEWNRPAKADLIPSSLPILPPAPISYPADQSASAYQQ